MTPAAAAILFAFAAVFLAHQYYGLPVTSDAAELARQSQFLESHQSLAVPSTASGAGNAGYPPFFAILLSEMHLLAGVWHFDALALLSYAFTLALVLCTMLLARRMGCSETEAVLAGACTVFMPLLFYRMVTPIAETLGLFLFALAVYSFDSRKYGAAFFVLLLLPLSHYRSFAVAAASILAMAAISGRLKHAVAVLAVPSLLYLIVVPKTAAGFANPWVIEQSAPDVFGLLVLAAAGAGLIYSLLAKKEGIDGISASLVVAFALTFVIAPFPFRQLAYLFPVAAKYASKIASVDFRVTASFLILGSLAVVQATAYRTAPFSQPDIAAFTAIDSLSGSVVAAPFRESNILPLYSQKTVVAGAFAESLPDGKQRLQDTWAYFHRAICAAGAGLVRNYGVSLFVNPPSSCSFSAKVLDNGKLRVFEP
ncbi:MAG: hypothetical protein V1708_05930 [Candidatus Micrarchaeota archaeon]